MKIHWKAVEQYFTVVLFDFQFYAVFNFGQVINFGPGIVRSEWVKLEAMVLVLLYGSLWRNKQFTAEDSVTWHL